LASYKSRTQRGIFSRCLFCAWRGTVPPGSVLTEPLTTEEKAGPELSEAGIEHEGI
jgi:hypothetical protein